MDLVHRLRGMFVIAVYDRLKDDVYLIRDHFGIKPLYYADRDGWFVFASEIRSILASGVVRPEVDPQSLWYYLTFQCVPDPGTMLRGIRKLAPAHYLRLHAGKVEKRKAPSLRRLRVPKAGATLSTWWLPILKQRSTLMILRGCRWWTDVSGCLVTS